MPDFDWEPDASKCVFLDFETQSVADLKAVGSRAYLRHPSTRVLCLAATLDGVAVLWAPRGVSPSLDGVKLGDLWPKGFERDGRPIVFDTGRALPRVLADAAEAGRTFVAHNAAGFDALAWEQLVGVGRPRWFDTAPCARAAGLPAGLDALGEWLLGRGKDSGSAAMKILCHAKEKHGTLVYPVGTVALWKSLLAYNLADVLLLERVFAAVACSGEPDVLAADARINARGVAVDLGLVRTLADLWQGAQNDAAARVAEITGGKVHAGNLRSGPQVKKWLSDQGLHVDTLRRDELERLYADPEEYFGETPDGVDLGLVVEVLKLRQTATRITKSKLDKLAALTDPDGRVRGMLTYWGAHTGRWAGRGFQPHNLSRGVDGLDVEVLMWGNDAGGISAEDVRIAAERASCSVDDALATLLRPVFRATGDGTLLIVDYAGVEARGLAWCAGEEKALEVFRDPSQDIYCTMASHIYGRPVTKADKAERFIGKTVVLGCGYGLGVPKFEAFCRVKRIDLAAAGTNAEQCVEGYRDAFPVIAGARQGSWRRGGLWKACGAAAMSAVLTGKPREAGRCVFHHDGSTLRVLLPSGRSLCYRGARVEDRVPGYAAVLGLEAVAKPTVVYRHQHGYEGTLYGGKITENIVQAVCRDLLATALVRLEEQGFPVVLHVHDEVVVDWPRDLAMEVIGATAEVALETMAEVMSTPPPWAAGFPVGVEGFSCRRYTKSPWSDSHKVKALGGRIL